MSIAFLGISLARSAATMILSFPRGGSPSLPSLHGSPGFAGDIFTEGHLPCREKPRRRPREFDYREAASPPLYAAI